MISQRTQRIVTFLAVFLLLTPPAFALQLPLSSEAVREAYFLGQRSDEKTALFFEAYRRHLRAPKSGPFVSMVELFTPYAEAVDVSRKHTVGYSAQQAEQEYRGRGNSVRIAVHVQYTPTYRPATVYPPSQQSGSEVQRASAPGKFWKGFQIRLCQAGKTLESRSLRYEGTRVGTGRGSSWPTGFIAWLEYDAEVLDSSDDATAEVDTPDGQHVVANFDLIKLR